MELYSEKTTKLFELISISGHNKSFIMMKKRVLIGSSDVCDFIISGSASPIHAILEITADNFKLYDMNSSQGTFLDGKKIVACEFKLGSTLSFGNEEFTFKDYKKEDVSPPPLDMLGPENLIHSNSLQLPRSFGISAETTVEEVINPTLPTVEYPLGKDAKADSLEYIFEDVQTLYPIFNYEVQSFGIEVIILFKDKIYSVDYLPAKNGLYKLTGFGSNSHSIEFAYLGKNDKIPFVEIKNEEIFIHNLTGFNEAHIGDGIDSSSLLKQLKDQDVFRFINGHLQILVKKSVSPPSIKSAPIFRRDPEFKKYLLLCLLFALFFTTASLLFKVDPEIEKEKAPERLATILYKRKIPKIINRKIKIDKKQKIIKKKSRKLSKKKAPKKKATKKVLLKKVIVKKGRPVPNKKVTKSKKIATKRKRRISKKTTLANTGSKRAALNKSKGKVDTFKSFDFKNSLSSMLAKGGSATKFKINKTGVGASSGLSTPESSLGKTVRLARVSKTIGSVKGSAKGKLDSRQSVSGLVQKKSIYTDGVPYKTVVRGGLDPDVIFQILVEAIPQFQYCYQKQLDISKKAFNGVVKLNFLIGASGYVARANATSMSSIPGAVKGCVINVLKGLDFPEPRGGGVVEVTQPMNFFPKLR